MLLLVLQIREYKNLGFKNATSFYLYLLRLVALLALAAEF